MGMRDEGDNFDLSGLPLYYVNKIFSKEMPDGSVMVVCGIRIGNAFNPLYATITPADTALSDGKDYVSTARKGMN